MPDPPVDYDALAELLAALAYPTRLELMDILRFPHSVSDIRLGARRNAPGENPDRPVSRATIHSHLAKLVEADFVREDGSPGARGVSRYQTNPQRVFATIEELRRLSQRYVGRGPLGGETQDLGEAGELPEEHGPRLVLVHGIDEGRSYALDASTAVDGAWRIGRKKGLSVWLGYDPYVSLENAEVRRSGAGFVIEDLPGSRNGTRVNWRPLPAAKPRPLKSGDIIGVGRSLLAFAAS